MTHNGCEKYNSASEIAPQGIFKGGKNRWSNPPRGYAEKDGQTGQAEQHHGNNVKGHGFVRNRRSVWTVPTSGFKGSHFATFPPELIRPCIASGCPPNGVVLDPFMGAGTTAIVALELNRDYVGVELNDKYVKIAEDRLLFKRG